MDLLTRARALLLFSLALAPSFAGCNGTSEPPLVRAQPAEMPRTWVFTAGISKYKDDAFSLKYADRDATSVAEFFTSPTGGRVPRERVITLVNEKADRATLLSSLEELAQRTSEDDLIIVFLAMHATGLAGEPFYFLAYDTNPRKLLATGISEDEIKRALGRRAKRVVMLLDTCHSGSFGFDDMGGKRALRAEETNRLLAKLSSLREQGTGVLAAAGQNEYSEEDKKWGGGHGVFTYYLLDGLKGSADQNHDGIITLRELYDYVYDPVKNVRNEEQHPNIMGNDKLPVVLSPYAAASVAPAAASVAPAAASVAPAAAPSPQQPPEPTPARSTTVPPTLALPQRPASAPTGSQFMDMVKGLTYAQFKDAVLREIASGNVPPFERRLCKVVLSSPKTSSASPLPHYAPVSAEIVLWVTCDYLAIGSDDNFVRVPLDAPSADRLADTLKCVLPTKRLVDAIYSQATVKLGPHPFFFPDASEMAQAMTNPSTVARHNDEIEAERRAMNAVLGSLVAGQKKDVVMSERLFDQPNRLALYGWQEKSGKPLQPLSLAHLDAHMEYAMGIRLVLREAQVNGVPRTIDYIAAEKDLSQVLFGKSNSDK